MTVNVLIAFNLSYLTLVLFTLRCYWINIFFLLFFAVIVIFHNEKESFIVLAVGIWKMSSVNYTHNNNNNREVATTVSAKSALGKASMILLLPLIVACRLDHFHRAHIV